MKKIPLFQTVKSLANLKANVIYQTTSYNLFKPIVGNRGEDKGFEEKRVRRYVKLIEDGQFFDELSVIIVTADGRIADGVNRWEACKRTNRPILFRVLSQPMFNQDDNVLLNIVAIFNGSNPTWSANQQYKAAKIVGMKLALQLSLLRSQIVMRDIRLSEKDISPNLMLTLVARDPKNTKARKKNLSEYNNNEYYAYAQTEEFFEEFEYVARIISYFKDGMFDASKVVKELLSLMWGDANFDKDAFYTNLLKKGFKAKNNTVKPIKAEILRLASMRVPRKVAVS